jgi:hypothetical protein
MTSLQQDIIRIARKTASRDTYVKTPISNKTKGKANRAPEKYKEYLRAKQIYGDENNMIDYLRETQAKQLAVKAEKAEKAAEEIKSKSPAQTAFLTQGGYIDPRAFQKLIESERDKLKKKEFMRTSAKEKDLVTMTQALLKGQREISRDALEDIGKLIDKARTAPAPAVKMMTSMATMTDDEVLPFLEAESFKVTAPKPKKPKIIIDEEGEDVYYTPYRKQKQSPESLESALTELESKPKRKPQLSSFLSEIEGLTPESSKRMSALESLEKELGKTKQQSKKRKSDPTMDALLRRMSNISHAYGTNDDDDTDFE